MLDYNHAILSTADLPGLLTDKAATEGIRLDTVPFIQTTALANDDLVAHIRALSHLNLFTVFTSPAAVKAVAGAIDHVPDNWKICCLSGETGERASRLFGEDRIVAQAPDAATLSEQMIQLQLPTVTFFCGNLRRDIIPTTLPKAGIAVNELMVYRTVLHPVVITEPYDGILFSSPSAVESFFSLNTVASATILFAIGQTTADAVKRYSDNTLVVNTGVGKTALVSTAIEYLHSLKSIA
jgi:uroporphyrinogen-III synthase